MAEKPPAGKKGGDKKGGAPSAGGRRLLYRLEGAQLKRLRKPCPKCGPGIFLAEHKNRSSCGNCGYTEFKK